MKGKVVPRTSPYCKRLVALGISALVFLFDRVLRDYVAAIFGGKPARRCVILYYHGIFPEQRERFGHQMDLLRRHTQSISCTAPPPLDARGRFAGVTFDDGLLSYKELALPELVGRGLPSTIFVPTQYLGVAPGWLMSSAERLMKPSEIREIAENTLVTIGSHGISHRPFTCLLPEEAKNEFVKSKEVLESIVGKKVVLFSFPHGAYCDEHLPMAREAGYERTFSIHPVCAFNKLKEYSVGRVNTDPSDWPMEFIFKVNGAYRWLPVAHRLKNIYSALLGRPSVRGNSQDRTHPATVGE